MSSGINRRQERTVPETIEVGGYQIYGVSVAAVETCICIPSLSLAFDAGKCPPGAVPMRFMAITHGHCDHVHGVPLHLATRNLQKLPAPRYFLPPEIEHDVRNLVDAVGRLEMSTFEFDAIAMNAGDEALEFKKGWAIKAFKTFHTVPSQGYTVYQKRKHLKPEYVGLTGNELARLRRNGADFEEARLSPEIAFTGDTSIDALAASEDFRKARILITEMTFIDDKCSPSDAKRFGHIHVEDVIENQDLFAHNEYVVFTHFSARYGREAILNAIARLPSPLKEKCIPFGIDSVA